MNKLIAGARAEFVRLRIWPTMWVLLASWIVLNLVFLYVFDYITYKTGGTTSMSSNAPADVLLNRMLPAAVPSVFTQGMAMFGGALMLILGALTVGSGYGWGTWKTAFTQGPSRTAVLGGTLAMLAVVVLALVAVVAVIDLGAATLIASIESRSAALPAPGELLRAVGAGALILGMWTSAGVLLGAIARGPALSVGLGLVWVLVVENLLRGVGAVLEPVTVVTDRLPGTAAGSLAGALRDGGGDATPGVVDILSGPTAAGVLAVYLVVFGAGAVWWMRRQEM
ncbi:ABC transporter permease [Rhodococcus chondri]|uniref:ABC transporter permease subunit n=1 Tax=Rhodococcus chondri TaxID=3065941 RepID=A0ABU7JZP8_9NOCA|nr:ABC transporter permease [Rhodococcus sp. CC-R104]MEE2035054.1 ABC transporter permease subunit [Rhodococcus sp. CC-R104]